MTPAQRWVLTLTSLAAFMIALDGTIVTTALTTIRRALHTSVETLEWTVSAYILTFAVLMLTGSALGDRFGRRRVFVAGLALFTAASAACGLSSTVAELIAARAVQGVGAAVIMPLAIAQLGAAFPPRDRGRAMGVSAGISTGIPPTQKAVVSAVQPHEIGQASGVFAMLRQFGALFGTAVAVAVFAGSGSYADPRCFTDGFTAAIGVGAGLAAVGSVAALMLPKLRRADAAPVGTGTPERETVAAA